MQCSSEGCSLAQWKDIHTPGGPSSGLMDNFWGVNKKQRSCDGRGARSAPVLHVKWAQKEGCAQRTGAHARPKPTSYNIVIFTNPFLILSSSVRSPPAYFWRGWTVNRRGGRSSPESNRSCSIFSFFLECRRMDVIYSKCNWNSLLSLRCIFKR